MEYIYYFICYHDITGSSTFDPFRPKILSSLSSGVCKKPHVGQNVCKTCSFYNSLAVKYEMEIKVLYECINNTWVLIITTY